MHTQHEAVHHARKRARETKAIRFVVFDDSTDPAQGPYHVATECDLDTFFAGIPERNILYSTEED
jgi:hypothetical protein